MGCAVHGGRDLFYVSHKIAVRNFHVFEIEMKEHEGSMVSVLFYKRAHHTTALSN